MDALYTDVRLLCVHVCALDTWLSFFLHELLHQHGVAWR